MSSIQRGGEESVEYSNRGQPSTLAQRKSSKRLEPDGFEPLTTEANATKSAERPGKPAPDTVVPTWLETLPMFTSTCASGRKWL